MNIITKKTDNPCGKFLSTKKAAKPEALIMVETVSLSFVLSCCSIPFYIIGLIGNVLFIRTQNKGDAHPYKLSSSQHGRK